MKTARVVSTVALIALTLLVGAAAEVAAPVTFPLPGGGTIGVPPWLLVALTGVAAGALGATLRGRGPKAGHDPQMLLPRPLKRRVRQAIRAAYEQGAFDDALKIVCEELQRDAWNLGLHFWSIRLLLETGRREEARAELVGLVGRLPEAALTVRWSALYESAGERDLWIRDVLERIRRGVIVRRSTFRELVRLLENANRFAEGLEVLERLRESDPPTPEEDVELTQVEMIMRVRRAEVYLEEGRADVALEEVRQAREHFTGWRSPYRLGFRALLALDRVDEAVDWVLEGYRNTGDPALILLAYERQRTVLDPVSLLERWDDALSDLQDDGWYLLTTAWIALRHDLIDEAVARLDRIAAGDPAWAHGRLLRGGLDADRGHGQHAASVFRLATAVWIDLPFLFQCSACGHIDRQAASVCPQCQGWETHVLLKPYGGDEAAVRALAAG